MASQGTFSDAFTAQNGDTSIQPAMPIVQPAASQGSLFDRAVLLSISISCLGIKRKVQSSEVEVEADKTMVHVSKDIIDSPILAEIKKYDGQTRLWIAERSLPSMFRSGVYLWPMALVLDADQYLQQRIEQRAGMINRFLDVYQLARVDAQSRLGTLYNPRDYPDIDKVRGSFSMGYQFIECGVPGRLRDISPAMFERERMKAESVWTTALDEARDMLRSELAMLVDHMADRLTPDEDGKPKRFKKSLVTNFTDFLSLFDARNLADDSELQAVVMRCREVLTGATSEQIRDDVTMRVRVAGGMASIREQLSGLVVDAGRRINLDTVEDDSSADRFGDI